MSKKKCLQGMDGMNLEYTLGLEGMEKLYLPVEELKNNANNTIVRIDCVGGKIRAYINAVHSIRLNNVIPFRISDAIKLELVRSQVIDFMQSYLKKHLQNKYSDEFIKNLKVTALEVNITLPCAGTATPSDVIHLFDMALDKTVVFRKRKTKSKCAKSNIGVQYTKPKEYRLKIYDKTAEQNERNNILVEKNLLRIECVFIDKSLKKMFLDKRTIEDILTKRAISTLCSQYHYVLTEDIIKQYIVPYLNVCKETLFESLLQSDSGKEISDTIVKHRELIVDIEVLRQALKKWYKFRKVEDRTGQVLHKYRKKDLGIPEGVIATIKLFHDSAQLRNNRKK